MKEKGLIKKNNYKFAIAVDLAKCLGIDLPISLNILPCCHSLQFVVRYLILLYKSIRLYKRTAFCRL